jgi:hypothetical protein
MLDGKSFWINDLACLLIVEFWVVLIALSYPTTTLESISVVICFSLRSTILNLKSAIILCFFSFLLSWSDCYKLMIGTRSITRLSKEFKMMVRWVMLFFHIHFPEHTKKAKLKYFHLKELKNLKYSVQYPSVVEDPSNLQ